MIQQDNCIPNWISLQSYRERGIVPDGHFAGQGGRSWQAFGKRKKMPSILLSAEYLLIGDKKCCFCAYHQNCNKSVVFAGNCKYLETLFLIILKAQTRSFLHFLLLSDPCRGSDLETAFWVLFLLFLFHLGLSS